MAAPRVLIIAEAANPEWVSVPLVGWSHSLALSKVAETHLVTQVRNRDAIERFGWKEGREFTAIDTESLAKLLWKFSDLVRGGAGKGWTAVTALQAPSYLYFEYLFWKKFRDELAAGRWDIVHRITPLSPTTPSLLAGYLKGLGVPYVVGPLNGGVPWPRQFDAARRAESEWLSYVRGAYRLVPGYRALRRNASALIAGSSDTFEEMPGYCSDRLIYVPENAIDEEKFVTQASSAGEEHEDDTPLRVAFLGRLVPYKGADMLLEAAAPLIRAGKLAVDIIGDGPQRSQLEELCQSLGLEDGVQLAGWIPHSELSSRLHQSDVLGFPSIREFGGGVVLEAMALGLVPVIVGYGGPKELVTPNTGVILPLGKREEIVASLAVALGDLVGDRAKVRRLGENARKRVGEYFTWDKKAQQMLEIYDWVLGSGEKPDWGMPFHERH